MDQEIIISLAKSGKLINMLNAPLSVDDPSYVVNNLHNYQLM